MDYPRIPDVRNAGRMFWEQAAEGRLVLPHCVPCNRAFWYPRWHCPHCGSAEVEWRTASGHGSVHTFTVVRRSEHPDFRGRVPYVVAMIDLDERVRIMSNVIGCAPEAVTIGMRVRCIVEHIDDQLGVPLFEPTREVT